MRTALNQLAALSPGASVRACVRSASRRFLLSGSILVLPMGTFHLTLPDGESYAEFNLSEILSIAETETGLVIFIA